MNNRLGYRFIATTWIGETLKGVILYITLKPYPMDYGDGKLLVDPRKMMNGSFKACGGLLGFLIGGYIERHFISCEILQGSEALPISACVEFALLFVWKELFAPAAIVPILGGDWGNLLARFLMVLFAVAVWPSVITKTSSAKSKAEQTA